MNKNDFFNLINITKNDKENDDSQTSKSKIGNTISKKYNSLKKENILNGHSLKNDIFSKNCISNEKDESTKNDKKQRLLDEGFKLFTTQGIKNTSIQNIVDKANVAKGTFYLYFKDKYELRDIIIMKKSSKLFNNAIEKLQKTTITNFSDQIVFIIDSVIDELSKDKLLLQFIFKDLGLGVFNKTIIDMYSYNESQSNSLRNLFLTGIKNNNIKLENPDATLFMIIELVSSTCFTCILYNEPLSMNDFKPILYKEIKKMIGE